MSNMPSSWGPETIPYGDQKISLDQNAAAFGLGTEKPRFGFLPGQRTVDSALITLMHRIQNDPEFTLKITEEEPEENAVVPAIVWSLGSRRPGIDGKGVKGPRLAEIIPKEDGTVLRKWVQEQTFQLDLKIVGSTSSETRLWTLALERWLFTNSDLVALCGIDLLQFEGEGRPSRGTINGAAATRERTLHYKGIMEYVYPESVEQIQSLHIWRASATSSGEYSVQTLAVDRQTIDSPVAYDLIPTSNFVVVGVHDRQDRIAVDYLYGVDYVLYVDRSRYKTTVQIHWLPSGKRPLEGTQYYVSFFYAGEGRPGEVEVISESLTDPGIDTFHTAPQIGDRKRRVISRPGMVPRVNGCPVNLQNPQEGAPIVYFSSQTDTNLEKTPTMANSLVDAITRAQTEVVSVLNPAYAPVALAPGRAFLPTSSTEGL